MFCTPIYSVIKTRFNNCYLFYYLSLRSQTYKYVSKLLWHYRIFKSPIIVLCARGNSIYSLFLGGLSVRYRRILSRTQIRVCWRRDTVGRRPYFIAALNGLNERKKMKKKKNDDIIRNNNNAQRGRQFRHRRRSWALFARTPLHHSTKLNTITHFLLVFSTANGHHIPKGNVKFYSF